MKKITILALALGTCSIAQAQVLSHGLISNDLLKTNYFLDASNFQSQADASKGKLLGFPKTDLTKFKFDLGVVSNDVVASGFDGVVVYNTATGKTLADASKGGKQVDVTPGFYYFSNPNGATTQTVSEGKWVRLSDGVSQEGQEWVYNPTNKRIELKRSGTSPFNNKVYYDENGVAYNGGYSEDDNAVFPMTVTDPVQGVVTKYLKMPFKQSFRGKVSMYDTLDNLPLNTINHPITGSPTNTKNQTAKLLTLSATDQQYPNLMTVGTRNQINVSEGNNNNYNHISTSTFVTNGLGSGKINELNGSQSIAHLGNSQSADDLRGSSLQASFDTSGNVSNLFGSQGTAYLKPGGTGNVTNAAAGYFYSSIGSKGLNTNVYGTMGQVSVGKDSGNATFVGGQLVAGYFGAYNSGRTQYKTQSGVYVRSTVADPTVATAPINNYGVFVENISGGSDSNYSIYTQAGQIRLGDLKGTGTRPVYADADGVLTAGVGGATQLEGTAGIECNEANRGKMNFQKDVAIGTGTGDAFAVCLKGTDGGFYWRYLYGAAGVANQTGTFGTGLQ
ncbi:hypothetical protein [Riemerella anatipestifer]|uniref:hypothetical protein n=1 Tax=Riemerella anatipestifer TaxID=34085 RepID=UPI00129ECDAB|nr:hypothetical protein [Riemerella anatipestifer]MRM83173.1 hypothetical protein [Riemerella anatipestifer]